MEKVGREPGRFGGPAYPERRGEGRKVGLGASWSPVQSRQVLAPCQESSSQSLSEGPCVSLDQAWFCIPVALSYVLGAAYGSMASFAPMDLRDSSWGPHSVKLHVAGGLSGTFSWLPLIIFIFIKYIID